MFNITALGDYLTSGNNTWYFLGAFFFIAACFWIYGLTNTPKSTMYAFSLFTLRYLYTGPFIILSSVAILYESFHLFQFEQQRLDQSTASAMGVTWHASYIGIGGALLGIIAGVFITYVGWRQWKNKRPDQGWWGPFN